MSSPTPMPRTDSFRSIAGCIVITVGSSLIASMIIGYIGIFIELLIGAAGYWLVIRKLPIPNDSRFFDKARLLLFLAIMVVSVVILGILSLYIG